MLDLPEPVLPTMPICRCVRRERERASERAREREGGREGGRGGERGGETGRVKQHGDQKGRQQEKEEPGREVKGAGGEGNRDQSKNLLSGMDVEVKVVEDERKSWPVAHAIALKDDVAAPRPVLLDVSRLFGYDRLLLLDVVRVEVDSLHCVHACWERQQQRGGGERRKEGEEERR
eukprot:757381-Hanusia_phi.AAC.6